MADRVASPNDPVFIVHHTMMDCMMDEWLLRHPDQEYPDVPLTFSTKGHQAHSYMIPFFPLHTNAEMFKPARNFGYYCDLPNINTANSGTNPKVQFALFNCMIFIILAVLY